MKNHILIVEDEVLLFRRLRNFLEKNNFTVDEFTPGYEKAIERIKTKRPDLVLLDINLEGEKDGIDLGKVLSNDYNIPFIYVTELDNDATFIKAFGTDLKDYIVKTKPVLNEKQLLRKIMIVLKEYNEVEKQQIGISAFTGYLEDMIKYDSDALTEIIVPFDEIDFITKDTFKFIENGIEKSITLADNYAWLVTPNGRYLIKASLRKIEKYLVGNFVRVNDKYIVNLTAPDFQGRINGNFIKIREKKIKITETYRKRFNEMYGKLFVRIK
jgi:CheY-like chemotaxis protein